MPNYKGIEVENLILTETDVMNRSYGGVQIVPVAPVTPVEPPVMKPVRRSPFAASPPPPPPVVEADAPTETFDISEDRETPEIQTTEVQMEPPVSEEVPSSAAEVQDLAPEGNNPKKERRGRKGS